MNATKISKQILGLNTIFIIKKNFNTLYQCLLTFLKQVVFTELLKHILVH